MILKTLFHKSIMIFDGYKNVVMINNEILSYILIDYTRLAEEDMHLLKCAVHKETSSIWLDCQSIQLNWIKFRLRNNNITEKKFYILPSNKTSHLC